MFEESINVLHLNGGEKTILEADDSSVKIPRTGIFICTGGWTNITLDGRSYHVVKDSMVVYFAYSDFHISNRSNTLTGILIGADLETIQPLLYNVSNFDAIFSMKQNPLMMLSIERVNRLITYASLIEDTIDRIKALNESITGDDSPIIPAREILIQQRKCQGQCLMLEIVSSYTRTVGAMKIDKRGDDILKSFMTSLYKNFKQEHEVNFYAAELCLTARYFAAVVKDRSGQTPSTWISAALLAEAKQMLQSSQMTVKEISDDLNFPNQSYFGKWFKTHTGISPLEYRSGKATKKTKDSDLAKLMPNGIYNSISNK